MDDEANQRRPAEGRRAYYVSAFDVDTGKALWKFYVTPGNPATGFENKDVEAAAKTWGGRWWEQGGGGALWDGMAYDPDENLLYFGTGNGAVWSSDVRHGGETKAFDNLYIASIVAVDADTGRLKWHYQCTPGDEWDIYPVQMHNTSQMSFNPNSGLIYVPIAVETLSLASNVVIQTLLNGRLKAFTADKGEPLLDMALPLTSGIGPPMTFMLDGKQYIAVMGGTGAGQFGPGAGFGRPQEPTAAAAGVANDAGQTPPAAPAPPNRNPKLFVYSVPK